jgi:hypothetical protein
VIEEAAVAGQVARGVVRVDGGGLDAGVVAKGLEAVAVVGLDGVGQDRVISLSA